MELSPIVHPIMQRWTQICPGTHSIHTSSLIVSSALPTFSTLLHTHSPINLTMLPSTKKWRHTQAKAAKHGVNDTVGSISSSGANSDSDCASGSDGEPKDRDLWEDEPEMGDESKPTGWNASAGLDDWVDDLAVLSDAELNNVVEASAPVQKVLSKASLLSPDTIYC